MIYRGNSCRIKLYQLSNEFKILSKEFVQFAGFCRNIFFNWKFKKWLYRPMVTTVTMAPPNESNLFHETQRWTQMNDRIWKRCSLGSPNVVWNLWRKKPVLVWTFNLYFRSSAVAFSLLSQSLFFSVRRRPHERVQVDTRRCEPTLGEIELLLHFRKQFASVIKVFRGEKKGTKKPVSHRDDLEGVGRRVSRERVYALFLLPPKSSKEQKKRRRGFLFCLPHPISQRVSLYDTFGFIDYSRVWVRDRASCGGFWRNTFIGLCLKCILRAATSVNHYD